MRVTAILAASEDAVIGLDGALPWSLPDDMAYFRATTMGHAVVTGRKSYESIPAKFRPLKGRTNIVVTRNAEYDAPGATVVGSVPAAVLAARDSGATECFVIGGGEVYADALRLGVVDRVLLTMVHVRVSTDQDNDPWLKPRALTYAPDFKRRDWRCVWEDAHQIDERHPMSFTYMALEKREVPDVSDGGWYLECSSCFENLGKNTAGPSRCSFCGGKMFKVTMDRPKRPVYLQIDE